jgi:hypothetical protein
MEHAADKHYPMAAYMIGRHYFYPGWDVSDWQILYDKHISGNISVIDNV